MRNYLKDFFKPKFKAGQVLIKDEEFAIHDKFPFVVIVEVGKKNYLYQLMDIYGYVGYSKFSGNIDYIDRTYIEYSKDKNK